MTVPKDVLIYMSSYPAHGRYGAICMMLADAGVPYKQRIITHPEWAQVKSEFTTPDRTPYGALPTLKIDGKLYSQFLPIMRYLARRLGHFDGKSIEDAFLVDAVADLTIDWFNELVRDLYLNKDPAVQEKFINELQPRYASALDSYLGQDTSGPYLLGEVLTYTDLFIYTTTQDSPGFLVDKYPNISALVQAVESRSSLTDYLAEFKRRKEQSSATH
ncbi:hypothetical protein THASP1DRAFT_25125 [Thamnocephalis sphaerospora]|uniref:Glutathione S-transferase n=1 Tax=Thamnocephalis sphaerospora TaxID=78915 RepID=A0A4P9XL61_9FUNG|nr:hypothetical protein THASP1DRAFT_25125 [Thamnocephalis sphaerospora]|eukprot:RKP06584.1 hypothetical protein THASP1DRAFT_25125 [Thamnocephalis sphaerospora]